MADRFIVGDTIRLDNTFLVDGTATDPGAVTLVVTDPQGNTEGTYTYAGGTVSKESTGVYFKNLAVDEDGVWEYTWTGTSPAADVVDGSFTVWPATVDDIDVLSLPEGKQAVGLAQSNTDLDDYLRSLITAVSGQLDMLCGPVRNRTVTDELHDGGDWYIQLRQIPVYSITTLSEYATTTATSLTAETNASKPTSGYLHDGTFRTLTSGRVIRRGGNADAPFASGRRNVAATYIAGRAANTEVVPAKFKTAASMMLRHLWVGEQASGSQTFGLSEGDIASLYGPELLNKVRGLLMGEMIEACAVL